MKQGSTFEQVIPPTLAQALGFTDLVGVTIASSVVTNDAVEHHLDVEVADESQLTFTLRGSSAGWKIGDANWDIKFTRNDGRVAYSDTFPVKVTKHYTT